VPASLPSSVLFVEEEKGKRVKKAGFSIVEYTAGEDDLVESKRSKALGPFCRCGSSEPLQVTINATVAGKEEVSEALANATTGSSHLLLMTSPAIGLKEKTNKLTKNKKKEKENKSHNDDNEKDEEDKEEEEEEEDEHHFAVVEYKRRTRSWIERRRAKALGPFCSCTTRKRFRHVPLCLAEVFLLLLLVLLLLLELWQMVALRRRYFCELETWFKLAIFTLALASIFFQSDFDVLGVMASSGICLAWIEVIFLIGRWDPSTSYDHSALARFSFHSFH
jgi:hypothetical protein